MDGAINYRVDPLLDEKALEKANDGEKRPAVRLGGVQILGHSQSRVTHRVKINRIIPKMDINSCFPFIIHIFLHK